MAVMAVMAVVIGAADPAVMVHQAVVGHPPIGAASGFHIDYTLINVADAAAKIVSISNLDSRDHDPLPESIPAHGGRVQFRAHIVPNQAGPYQPAPIKVNYVIGDQAVQSVLSTDVDPVVVLSNEDYASATEKFVKQYAIFGAVAALMVVMPALQIVRDYFFYTHGCPNRLMAPYRRSKQN